MSDETQTTPRQQPSDWAIGGVVFGGSMLIVLGIFQFFEGLAAVIEDEFYVVLPNYAYDIDVSAWGWIHMIIGVALALTGIFLFRRSTVAAAVAIVVAAFSAVSNFFFLPYYPLWSILIIAIAVFVIWAITRSGVFDS